MVTDSNVRAIEGGYSQDLDEFEAILSWFNYYVDTSAADGRNARHKDAEAIYMRLLNALYGWKLEDANEPGHVEPAVDLKDKERHIVVQVTSSCTSRKINCTLKKDRLAYYHDEGYRLKFVFIGDQRNRAKVRNENGWVISNPHDIAFDRYTDTVFTDDLTHAFSGLRTKHRAKVLQLIRDDIGRFGSSSQTQSITIDEKDLVELINLRLHRQRRDHPSFRLMRDEVISSLLPKGIEPKEGDLIPVDRRLVKPDEGKPILFRDFLCDSWSKGTQTHLLITGRGGIGKTVALLAFATERGFLPKNVPAVYIPLYDLARYSAFSRDCIDHYLEKNFSTMEARELIRLSYEPWRKGPRVILLLDGHNEIPVDKIHGVDDGIQAWAIRAGTQLVTTSRIPGFFGAIHTQWLELQGLSEAEVKKSIRDVTSTHVAINERLLQVLETPLMLKLYVDIELYRNWMQQRRLPLADSDSAGHLVWNYLQRELFRCTEVDKGYVQNIEYAVALLLVLPYVCWRMERKHEFKISEIAFNEYVGEACNYWKDRKKPSSFVKTENALLSHFNSMDLSKLNELITTILLNEEGFFVWNRGGYSLMHQSLRDGLAAIHLNNVITLMPSKLPFEFTLSISEYVSSFLVDMAEREPLMHLWELNRNEQRTNTISTHNILRVIHGYFDGDLSELNWSGMDLSRTNLYSFRCGHALKLSPDPSHFNDTVIDVKCFIPQGHSGTINAVCFTPDGSLLASCSDDGTVRLWDVSSGRHVISLAHGLHRLNSISFNIDGSLLAVGTDNGAVVLWDISTGDKHCMPFKNEKSPIWAVCINQQGTILAAGTEQGYVELWSIAAHQPLMIMMLHNSSVKSICFSPDGSILFSGSYDGTIILWSVKKCEPIGEPLRVGGGSIWSIAISPDGAYLACGASDGKVRLWKTSKAGLHSIRIFEHGGWLRTVGFSADGSLLASGSTDGTVRIWNLAAVRQTSVIDVHSGQIRSIHFSSDGHLLASGSDAGTIKLWDVLTGRPAGMKLVRKKLSLRTACFSPTGREIAIGAEDSSIELWDTRTGRIMQTAYVRSKDVANAIVF